MIQSIEILNFKSITEVVLNFSGLNVLIGMNNSGKSTVIQAIKMGLRNSGYIKGFGGYSDLVSKLTSRDNIKINIKGSNFNSDVFITKDTYNQNNEGLVPILEYISAERIGPSLFLPNIESNISSISVGEKGEFIADYYTRLEQSVVHEYLNLNSNSISLQHNLKFWMEHIAHSLDLRFFHLNKQDISYFEVNGFRPTNVGFGISYSLPIILASLGLTASRSNTEVEDDLTLRWFEMLHANGAVLIVENPEAHLHPAGQSKMGELLALVASTGVQVFIETHSDHVLDGIRAIVKEDIKVSSDLVNILYFTKSSEGVSNIQNITIKENGKLSSWPEGFFDQKSKDLKRLI